MQKKNFLQKNYLDITVALLPLSFLIGNFAINANIFLFCLLVFFSFFLIKDCFFASPYSWLRTFTKLISWWVASFCILLAQMWPQISPNVASLLKKLKTISPKNTTNEPSKLIKITNNN